MVPFCVMAQGVHVTIEGVEAELQGKLLASLSIARQKDTETLTAARIRQLNRRSQKEIRQILQAHGYYHPQVEAELQHDGEAWQAHYRISPGIPVKVQRLDIQVNGPGVDDPLLTDYLRELPIKQGDVVVHGEYEKIKRGLLERALDAGYLDAELTRHELRIDVDANQAVVVLYLSSGPAYTFGPIDLIQPILEPSFLKRFIEVKEGDRFNTSGLLALENGLRDSDYFSRIEVQPRRERMTDHAIPVDVTLTPQPRNKYTFGLGYGTDTGARGSLGWERRWANRAGHRMGADLKVAERRDSLTGRYIIPIRDPRTDRYTLSASYTHDRPELSESRIGQLGVARSIARGRWQETLFLNYHREAFIIADQDDTTRVLYPGVNWEWVKAKDRVYAERGSRVNFELRGANEAVVSDVTFLQARVKAKHIQPLWESARLITRAEVGDTNIKNIRDLPASMRFFAGGDQSVRGYAYNSLGTVNEDGEVIGSRRLLVGSLELEQSMGGNWSVAAFYDVGNAVEKFSDNLVRGAGVGIRWKSPIGQIRFDVAAALSKPDNPLRLHIVIGPDL